MPRPTVRALLTLAALSVSRAAFAQASPPAATTPDDTPSVRVGVTLFTDFTVQQSPDATDADGNTINPTSFNVSRSYINILGNLSHIVTFRITPDIVRESALVTLAPGSTVSNDSLVFRIKYAFAQFNLEDWMPKGTWVRLGIHQTPLIEYEESIYRYRFQGLTFTEREGFYSSSDAGASVHLNLPSNFGEVHAGFYNGEGYARSEVNDQKAFEIRGTARPFAHATPTLRGLRVTGFWFADHYVRNAERTRVVGQATYESTYFNGGFDAIKAHDRPSITLTDVESSGWSFWANPKSPSGWELLFRHDHLTPDTRIAEQARNRTIAGVAYWFPHEGNVSAALLLDYDGQTFDNMTPSQPKQAKVAVHALVNF